MTLDLLPNCSGVYMIKNLLTGERYIGQSKNMVSRQLDHLAALVRGTHPCKVMQAAFKRDGLASFTFEVVEAMGGAESRAVIVRERIWIRHYKPEYTHAGQGSRDHQGPSSPPPPPLPVIDHVKLLRSRQWDHAALLS